MEPDLLFRPITELGHLVSSGELSARELVETSLRRIEALDGEVNAFIHLHAEEALAAADAIRPGDPRPFAGVPVAIKTEVAVKGSPLTFGSKLFGDYTPDHDSFQVRRLKEAGMVVVGRTNMPEAGIMPITEPTRFGATRNPWDLGRTPGGSSGGSAAAVAAGMVPAANALDGGGSIRIPAACCGLVGLKPARNRISMGPEIADSLFGVTGAVTRTVDETAQMLDVMAGYEAGDANWTAAPGEPFAVAAQREPRPLRIGLVTAPPVDAPLDPEHTRALREAADLLASLGHEVEEVDTPGGQGQMEGVFLTVFGAYLASIIRFGGLIAGREPTADDVEPLTWAIYESATGLSAVDFLVASAGVGRFARQFIASTFSKYDVLLSPTLVKPPVPIGTFDTGVGDVAEWARTGEFASFTPLANITGQPAISLPLDQTADGLPIGIQLVGPPAGEAVLLSLSTQLEAARPWADRRAPLPAAA
ncbi:MAG TPA: amidase [Solirubrobacteraceae bacterium]|jgi:amidase|nr:amidase [Solirubrobacteraceae bacterium]